MFCFVLLRSVEMKTCVPAGDLCGSRRAKTGRPLRVCFAQAPHPPATEETSNFSAEMRNSRRVKLDLVVSDGSPSLNDK